MKIIVGSKNVGLSSEREEIILAIHFCIDTRLVNSDYVLFIQYFECRILIQDATKFMIAPSVVSL